MNFFFFFLLIFLNFSSYTQQTEKIKKWYKPNHVRVQFAGNIGMFSLASGWSFFNNNLELSLSLGYVPKFVTYKYIYITSFKAIYKYQKLDFHIKNIHFKPLAFGLATNNTIGKDYNKYQNSKLYSNNYYWWNISHRFALLYEAEVYIKLNTKYLNGLSIYFETSLWDLYLISYYANKNRSYLSLWDIVTFAIGTKLFF